MIKTAQEYKEDFLKYWRDEMEKKLDIFQKYMMCLEGEEDGKTIWLEKPTYMCPYNKFLKEIATHNSTVDFLEHENVIRVFRESPTKKYVIYNRDLKII